MPPPSNRPGLNESAPHRDAALFGEQRPARGRAWVHCHVGSRERVYAFVSVEQLVEDFIAAVDAARSSK